MKKLTFAAVMLMVGATVAVASSLGVPWFVDGAPERNAIPGLADGVTGIIYLKSNVPTTLVCSIDYYNQAGDELGPFAPYNTFSINPNSALAFRPVATDPDGQTPYPYWDSRFGTNGGAGGQEGGQGVKVPNRPLTVVVPSTNQVDTKKNGSLVISWVGNTTDVQGFQAYFQTATTNGVRLTMSYAHLLPPGF